MSEALLWADRIEVTGDPDAVRQLARGLQAYADELDGSRTRLTTVLVLLADWTGAAADACTERLHSSAARLAGCRDACACAAEALAAYAVRLEDAKAEAASARATWREADDITAGWGARRTWITGVDATLTSRGDDPGALLRAQAGAVLGSAFDQQDTAARAAARVVDASEQVLDRQAAHRTLTELVTHVGRDAGQGLAAGTRNLAASGVWLMDATFDPRGGARDVRASTASALEHPVLAAQEAANWSDLTGGHAARAVSEAVPGVAANVLTGGAARALGVGRGVAPDADSRLWDLPRVPDPTPLELAGGAAEVRRRAGVIARGHAWTKGKHAQDWARLGLRSPTELAAMVEEAMTHPTFWAEVSNGRVLYWDESQSLFVAYDPNNRKGDEGSAYRPDLGAPYFYNELAKFIRGRD